MIPKQELVLQLHPLDYHRLVKAAALAGSNISDFARLAVHREVSAILVERLSEVTDNFSLPAPAVASAG